MKKTLLILFCFVHCVLCAYGNAHVDEADSLLLVLDKTIADREIYAQQKEEMIWNLKQKKTRARNLEELYLINSDIISQYESYVCDSTEFYIHQNIAIAKELNNSEYLSHCYLKLFYVYSLSGLFVQAEEVSQSLHFETLPPPQKALYCWCFIRYYENLMKYTDDKKFNDDYLRKIDAYRDVLMRILSPDSEEYRKEHAFKLQQEGDFDAVLEILTEVFQHQDPQTHAYAMAAMSLAKVYRLKADSQQEERFLKVAAIADVRLAVRENEALLVLASNLFERGDVERSYTYITAALNDANFYNSRFKNTVIARVQPIIEGNYMNQIGRQSSHLRIYAIFISLCVLALAITLYLNHKQVRIVSRARQHLAVLNNELTGLNQKLDEANLIKERYVGYFMNKCSFYIHRLDEYRKDVNHKIKNGQIERLYKPSTRELENDIEELCFDFDEAFLKLYPDFVNEFNALLRPDEQFVLEQGKLNSELRIFALMRLGIKDVNQISVFLHCSAQTIYNYKSKVKSRSVFVGEQFDDKMKKIGSLLPTDDSKSFTNI